MSTKPIDYSSLAQQARSSVDYGALAKQARNASPTPQVDSAEEKNDEGGFLSGLWDTTIGGGIKTFKQLNQAAAKDPNAVTASQIGKNIVQAQGNEFRKAKEAWQEPGIGGKVEAAGHALAGALPLIGPAAAHAGEEIGKGNVGRGLGEATGLLLPSALKAGRGVLAKATEPVQNALNKSAVADYERALPGKTLKTKAMSGEVVPGLIDRRVTAMTRGGLLKKLSGHVESLGQQIDNLQSQIPEGTMSIPLDKAMSAIDRNLQDRFTVPSINGQYVASPDAAIGLATGQRLKKLIQAAAEPKPQPQTPPAKLFDANGNAIAPVATPKPPQTIDYQLLRRFKQNWDESIAKAGGFANNDFVNNAKMGAYREAAGGIRELLNDATPNIAAINREFHFWKTAQDVLSDTIQRTKGQSQPLGQQLASAAGHAAGFAKGGLGQAVLVGAALKNFRKLVTSTGWNTMSAVAKDMLADALASGDSNMANMIMITTMLGTAQGVTQPQTNPFR